VAAGFELRVRRVTKRCEPFEEAEFVYQVSREGKATLLSTKVVSSDPQRCLSD
jgi:hypothetical protein